MFFLTTFGLTSALFWVLSTINQLLTLSMCCVTARLNPRKTMYCSSKVPRWNWNSWIKSTQVAKCSVQLQKKEKKKKRLNLLQEFFLNTSTNESVVWGRFWGHCTCWKNIWLQSLSSSIKFYVTKTTLGWVGLHTERSADGDAFLPSHPLLSFRFGADGTFPPRSEVCRFILVCGHFLCSVTLPHIETASASSGQLV